MKNIIPSFLVVATVISLCTCSNPQVQQTISINTDSIKQIILGINSLQQSLLSDTLRRSDRFASLCADSLITVIENGTLHISAYEASHDLVDGYADTIHDIRFQLYGSTAVLTGIAKMYDIVYGDTVYENVRITKVFVQENGKWKMAVRTASPLPVNYFKPVVIDIKKLDDYVGVYRWPKNEYDTVRILKDHLVEYTRNQPPVANYPLNDSTFFAKEDNTTIVFGRDANGKVDHLTWILVDGQRVRIPKEK